VRRIVFTVLALVALVPASAHAQEQAPVCAAPDCVDVQVPVPAGLKVPENRVRVLLPKGYAEDPCRAYPVLYLLHGVGDDYTRWSQNTDVIAFTRDLPVIVVMPDGGGNPEAGWYSDWVDGSRQWETFHMDVLVPYIDRTFRTLGPGHRLIAGASMGGFGAMSYSARHPGMFRAAASFSGIVNTMYAFPVSGPGFALARPYFGTPDDRIWGNQLEDEATWREHNPADRAADLTGTELFLTSGMGAPTGPAGDDPAKAPNYVTEHVIFQMNLSFVQAVEAAGLSAKTDFTPGYHDWPYWERALHWALPQMVPLAVTDQTTATCPATASAVKAQVLAAAQTAGGGSLPATGGTDATAPALVLLAVALVSRRARRAA
jgi:diacylglycerol O-acyltransferase / trehalose O-mycolyltransferase